MEAVCPEREEDELPPPSHATPREGADRSGSIRPESEAPPANTSGASQRDQSKGHMSNLTRVKSTVIKSHPGKFLPHSITSLNNLVYE